jgi:hypothetical protein
VPQSDAEFAEAFWKGSTGRCFDGGIRSFLRGFDLRAHGLVAAGGFPAAILAGAPPLEEHDLDLFLVGHPDDAARAAAVVALFRHLLRGFLAGMEPTRDAFRDMGMGCPDVGIVVHRTRGCVSFSLPLRGKPIQVVLRAYSTVSEVLHGFDLGAAQVAFDGERVFLTAAGVLAATRGANVLNLAVRRVSYEARLVRYLMRGYDLVVPDLDVKAVRDLQRSPLPGTVVDEDPRPEVLALPRSRGPLSCCRVRLDREERPLRARIARQVAPAGPAGGAAPPDGAAAAEPAPPAARLAAAEAAVLASADGPGPEADYTGAADYTGGEIPYGNLDRIVLRNARLLGAPRWGEALSDAAAPPALRDPGALLCAAARTADEDFDVLGFAPDPFPDFERFTQAALGMTRGLGVLPPWQAEIILGPRLAGRPGRLRAAPPAQLRALWEARRDLAREALAAADFGPAAFAPVADRTALSGDPRYATTPAEWLGPLFAGPAAEK